MTEETGPQEDDMSTARINRTAAPTLERAEAPGSLLTSTAAKALAALRVATGFVFLWAFLDKTFGLGYSTPAAKSWIHGGSPTKGFLASVDVGPFQSAYHAVAGAWWVNWLFMLGMLGVGVALIAGIGLRVSAAAGALMMALMWFAEYPLARHTATGAPSASTNPLTDYHFIYAAVLIVLAVTYAGHVWGLGRRWARLPLVQRHRWLI
jgi:thiosulfate dehydrogenase [quinone] large subunit